MIPRRPVQRAFTGLAGRSFEPEDAAPAPVAAREPIVVSETAPRAQFGSSVGGLTGLASQAYRPRRDPTTGRVIEDTDYSPEIYIHSTRAAWRAALHSAGIAYIKCVHGHMYSEHYCEVCRLTPIDPDYDPDVYRTEIDKAMTRARKALTGSTMKKPRFEKLKKDDDDRKPLTEGDRHHQDLMQIIDIELWKASKKYGDDMSAALAYTIVDNQVGKYLTNRIKDQTVESTDPEGNVIRIPRFESMDDKPLDEDGKVAESSAVEVALVEAQDAELEVEMNAEAIAADKAEKLQTLVAGWHGQKRLVAEAMLRPGFNVRNVPGVPKSTVARVRQAVLREFKSFISKGLTK